jgi:type I restriction-modification system DNA methylase subunit
MQKINERTWTGKIIAWITEAITNGVTVFQEATNDAGIKLDSGVTKFPDILLFTDKVSGIVFNGWELKFPDTPADDREMLLNALEKAKKLQSNSFVTWNGSVAIIWKINGNDYVLESLTRLKEYPAENGISNRNDLANPESYQRFEPALRKRLLDILHDLEQFKNNGDLKEAINISSDIVNAVADAAKAIIPQIQELIQNRKGESEPFRKKFQEWLVLENATIKILSSLSGGRGRVVPENILAKFFFYKLIGKILFYQTLSQNLSGKVKPFSFIGHHQLQKHLDSFFNQARQIDYQAVFESDFTDELQFNETIEKVLFRLIEKFNEFDFRILPTQVIGSILENLVPKNEKQKFGQYFTSERLANLVAFSAVRTKNFTVIDPTCGTGTFLVSSYNILRHFGQKDHKQLLNQVWGNDISHFPAVLSVINLYKLDLKEQSNFPRTTRQDYFHLTPHQKLKFPDAIDIDKLNEVELPTFDAIVSNFPFIRQEDIPSRLLSQKFENEFALTQPAFAVKNRFSLNERSDFYIYCFYNSLKFLKDGGYLAAITSNAWLGKDYGFPFKRFLLDNFSIEYVFRSNAEHWFQDSKVSTIFITLKKGTSDLPTKFVTLNFKLNDFFREEEKDRHFQQLETLYGEIDTCECHPNWQKHDLYPRVFNKKDGTISVSVVERDCLLNALKTEDNWAKYFIAENPLAFFEKSLIKPFPDIFDVGRGTKTCKDKMFILSKERALQERIETDFLIPTLKTNRDLESILYDAVPETFLFVCNETLTKVKAEFPNAYRYVKKFETATNEKGIPLPIAFEKHKPFWYSLTPEKSANIFISINPNKRLFFSYSKEPIYLNQRLIALRTDNANAQLIAALLNSVLGLLIVEFIGVSRNLGSLDLNAVFFKTKMKMLNPSLLTNEGKQRIIKKFRPLSERAIKDYGEEMKSPDRIAFDQTVLREFGYAEHLLTGLYEILNETVANRVEMKNK